MTPAGCGHQTTSARSDQSGSARPGSPPIARLIDVLSSCRAIIPQAGHHHPLSQRLSRQMDLLDLGQFIGGKRRAEVRIALALQSDRAGLQRLRQTSIAWSAMALGSKSNGTAGPQALHQPQRMPHTYAEQPAASANARSPRSGRRSVSNRLSSHLSSSAPPSSSPGNRGEILGRPDSSTLRGTDISALR